MQPKREKKKQVSNDIDCQNAWSQQQDHCYSQIRSLSDCGSRRLRFRTGASSQRATPCAASRNFGQPGRNAASGCQKTSRRWPRPIADSLISEVGGVSQFECDRRTCALRLVCAKCVTSGPVGCFGHGCFCRGWRAGYSLVRLVASPKPLPGKDLLPTDPKSGTRPAELQGPK